MTQQEFQNHMTLMSFAGQLAAGVLANLPDDLKEDASDPNKISPEMEADNVTIWRLTRTFYFFTVGTLGNAELFPPLPGFTGGTSPGGGASPITPVDVANALSAALKDKVLADPLIAQVRALVLGS